MKPEVTAAKAEFKPGLTTLRPGSSDAGRPLLRFGLFALVLTVAFSKNLIDLARFAGASDLFSYVLLIPVISGYLIWQKRRELVAIPCSYSPLGLVPLAAGFAALGVYWLLRSRGWHPSAQNYFCGIVLAFYSLLLAGGFLFLGGRMMRAIAFPAAFLLFMVPLPEFLVDGLEVFFQYTSAEAANVLLFLTGPTYLRDGLEFRLPGIHVPIKVGQECSGIRSSLVLFMVSLLAGNLFLRTRWHRLLFAALVVPLGILRNGFRIWTIAMLIVHVDPSMIDSPIHHRGGPIFFILSLVPFFLVLLYLKKREARKTGIGA